MCNFDLVLFLTSDLMWIISMGNHGGGGTQNAESFTNFMATSAAGSISNLSIMTSQACREIHYHMLAVIKSEDYGRNGDMLKSTVTQMLMAHHTSQ